MQGNMTKRNADNKPSLMRIFHHKVEILKSSRENRYLSHYWYISTGSNLKNDRIISSYVAPVGPKFRTNKTGTNCYDFYLIIL